MADDNMSFSDIPEKSASYYDRNTQAYSDTNQNVADFIDEFLSHLKQGQKILDVGSGHGVNANYMQSKGFDVIGIDSSRKMVEYAKSKYPKIEFRLGDMT